MNNILKRMFFSVLISLVVVLILAAAFSLALPYISRADKIATVLGWVLRSLACLFTAFLCVKGSRSKGLIKGMAVGFIYAVFILLLSMAMGEHMMKLTQMAKILSVCVLCGAIGGVWGVNCRQA